MNFHKLSKILRNFADLGAARSSSKWIFPSMGLCKYIYHVLNLVLVQHKAQTTVRHQSTGSKTMSSRTYIIGTNIWQFSAEA